MKLHQHNRTHAHTLLISVIVSAILLTIATGCLLMLSHHYRLNMRNQVYQSALPLAEASVDLACQDVIHTATVLNQYPEDKTLSHTLSVSNQVIAHLEAEIDMLYYISTNGCYYKWLKITGKGTPESAYFSNSISRSVQIECEWSSLSPSNIVITSWSEL